MSYINAHRNRDVVTVWERNKHGREVVRYDAPYYFYVEDSEGEYTSLFGDKVRKVEQNNMEDFSRERTHHQSFGKKVFESDIGPEFKVLAKHYYKAEVPDLNITYLDIEVDYDKRLGFSSVKNPYAPINSIALTHSWNKKTILIAVPPETWGKPDSWNDQLDQSLLELADVRLVRDEHQLLKMVIDEIEDSDGLCGWNSDFFDMPYIAKRLEMMGQHWFNKLSFDGAPRPRWREVEVFGQVNEAIDLGGRLSVDYMQLFKKFEMGNRPSYKLDAISKEVLPHLPKLEYDGNLADLYKNNFNHFMRYNIRDTECLTGFEDTLGYVALANVMYHDATGLFKNVMGTIKLAELSLVNYCHDALDLIAPDVPVVGEVGGQAQGALVLKPKSGLQEWIGSIDINSLYPSAIRAVNISPETLLGQFDQKVDAFEAFQSGSDLDITLRFENGQVFTKPAYEWRDVMKEKRWAISGYGTVFDQNKQGIIPAILESWYGTRKKYKKEMENLLDVGKKEEAAYYDRMQYCYKIKLNSLYGALLNKHFRFYDPRMGESTTGTGRAILKYMCAKVNETLVGEFDPDGEAIVYGDTDSCYFSTGANNKEDGIFIADSVADIVNASFPAFMRESCMCSDGYDHIIAAGRECVASRGIFVTPKRYVLNLVNLDGYDCDKLKVMGLDTKKTILPVYIQDALNGFIERYLKGEDWETVAVDVVQLKDDLLNQEKTPIVKLGLPKGVNKVEYYTEQMKLYGAGARLPGHVAASIYYNQKRKENNDMESLEIVSSMKIRIFYLKAPDGRFKSIALPSDLDRVPDWFYEQVAVDKNKQITRLVDNPLENILKAVGKVPPSKQTLFIDSVLEF